MKNCCGPNLGENLWTLTFVLSPDPGLNMLNNFDFDFEWRDTENQQYLANFEFGYGKV